MTCSFRYKTKKDWKEVEVEGRNEIDCIHKFQEKYDYDDYYSYMPLIT